MCSRTLLYHGYVVLRIESICSSIMASSSTNNTFSACCKRSIPWETKYRPSRTCMNIVCRGKASWYCTFTTRDPFIPCVMNDNWRRSITAALSSDPCLTKMAEEDFGESSTCDTCSLLSDPMPGLHYPGNMWVQSLSSESWP
jgi:hypothetical protein